MYRGGLKNEIGYSLITSLFQLAVFMISAQIITLLIIWFYNMMNLEDNRDEIEWMLFVTDFHNLFERVYSVSVGMNQNLYFYDPDTTISQNSNQAMLYRVYRNDNHLAKILAHNVVDGNNIYGGYEILLPYVKRAEFKLEGNVLTIRVEMKSGKMREREFIVKTHSE